MQGFLDPLAPVVNTLAFPHPRKGGPHSEFLRRNPNLVWLTLANGDKVPALFLKRTKPRRAGRVLVLYSHGNAEDLPQLPKLIDMMVNHLDADVLAYEYPGYSIADGAPSEKGLYAAALAAYQWAVRPAADGGGGAAPDQIVPFGRSLGSVPACYMCSVAPEPLGGLLLQSPLLTGASAMLGKGVATVGSCIDVFKNSNYILKARCRVAIAHGTDDFVVPLWNGHKLHSLCADPHTPLWCEGRGHNDLDEEVVFEYMRGFLDQLKAS